VTKAVTHFVGFRDDRYWNAVKVFGLPDFIHPGWDLRAQREICIGDTVVFATGTDAAPPRRNSYSDIVEPRSGGLSQLLMCQRGKTTLHCVALTREKIKRQRPSESDEKTVLHHNEGNGNESSRA
jgi:hypothetical protein